MHAMKLQCTAKGHVEVARATARVRAAPRPKEPVKARILYRNEALSRSYLIEAGMQ